MGWIFLLGPFLRYEVCFPTMATKPVHLQLAHIVVLKYEFRLQIAFGLFWVIDSCISLIIIYLDMSIETFIWKALFGAVNSQCFIH